MSHLRPLHLIGLLLVVMNSQDLLGQPDEKPPDQRSASLNGARAVVKSLEERLASEEKLLKQKILTEGSVDTLRVRLAKARHDLALSEEQTSVIKEQRQVVLEIRQRELARLQKARRPPAEISTARRRLATARYLVAQMEGESEVILEQLHLIVHLCQQDLELLKKLGPKVIPAFEVHDAENRLVCVQYLLAIAEDKSEGMTDRLRSIADALENDWKNTDKLYRQKTATLIQEYLAHVRMLNSQLRLANSEKKRDVVLELLRQLIAKHEATLKAVDVKEKDQQLLNGINFDLSRDLYRMKSVSRGGALDVLAVPELD